MKNGSVMKLTKTQAMLLARDPMHGRIVVNGKREVDAAKALVTKGLAAKFDNHSCMSRGEYYIHPFSRRQAISKTIFVYGGYLYPI